MESSGDITGAMTLLVFSGASWDVDVGFQLIWQITLVLS